MPQIDFDGLGDYDRETGYSKAVQTLTIPHIHFQRNEVSSLLLMLKMLMKAVCRRLQARW